MRFYTAIALTSFGVLATLFACSSGTNSTWGYVGPYDKILDRQFIVEKSHWLQVVSRHVTYAARGYNSNRIITAVKAIDHARKNGGYAMLLRGGPGRRDVTVHVRSQRGKGLNFTVEIWGH